MLCQENPENLQLIENSGEHWFLMCNTKDVFGSSSRTQPPPPPPHSVGDAGGGSSRDVGDTTTTLIQIPASASSTGALFYGLLVVPSGLRAHEEATS
jgi:hypothetical protein